MAQEEMSPPFQAAAATSNITPPLGEPVIGSFAPFPSKHVHDELLVRCLVLDDGQVRLALADTKFYQGDDISLIEAYIGYVEGCRNVGPRSRRRSPNACGGLTITVDARHPPDLFGCQLAV